MESRLLVIVFRVFNLLGHMNRRHSCQIPRSANRVNPKPAPKGFLIFRIELLVLVDHLSAHRTPPAQEAEVRRGIVGVESDEMCELLHTLNASFLECR